MQDKRKRLLQWHPALFSGLQIELSEETNLWLKSLMNDLKSDRAAERLLHAYEKHRTEGLYQSVMDVVIRANEERFMVSDMREMCEALDELLDKRAEIKAVKLAEAKGMEQGLSRGLSQGLSQGLLQGKQQKLLDLIRKKSRKEGPWHR